VALWQWGLAIVSVAVIFYAALVLALVLGGREHARAVAGFVPDCLVLFRRLVGDSRVPAVQKALLLALIGYLATPVDLVPDFIPIAGQLDDAIVVALVLRAVLRASGEPVLREHWPGPPQSLRAVQRLAFGTPG
jgi:uncharacterized membrane protein YkvA (DUF1232 family)